MNKQWVIFSLLFLILLVSAAVQPNFDFKDTTEDTVKVNEIITIAAVGDIMMGSTYPTPILPPKDGKDLFSMVKNDLIWCDLTIGNLEAPFCDSYKPDKDTSNKNNFIFRTPARYVKNLADAGFDVVNLANNHIGDFGKEGINSTKQVLEYSNIKYTGLLGDIAELKIKNKRIFVIGFSPHYGTYSLLNIPKAQRIVARLKRKGDIVIVTFHGGNEGYKALHTKDTLEFLFDDPRGNVVKFSHAVIDSGADLVFGHGPHVPRALEIYKNKLIAYSLGNFCPYGRFNVKGVNGLSLILKVNLDFTGNFIEGKIIPLYQESPGIPKPDSIGRSIKLINNLSQYDFPLTAPDIDIYGVITPKSQQLTSIR